MRFVNDKMLWKVLVLFAFVAGLTACPDDDDDDNGSSSGDMPMASYVVGQSDFTERNSNQGGSPSAFSLSQPKGGVASNGTVFLVPDTGNSRILGFNGSPSQNNEAADFVLGQSGFESNSAGSSSSQFAFPSSASIGGDRLLVADSGNHRVLIWGNVPTTNTSPSIVVGQSDFNNSSSGIGANRLSSPSDAAIAAGKLFVADRSNHRVLIWNSIPTSNGEAADVVLGQADFDGADSGTGDEGMNSPSAVWSDGYRLLVADTGNSRILVWNEIPANSGEAADYVIGQSTFSATTATVGDRRLNHPEDVTSDGLRIFIADTGNNRVVGISSFPVVNGVEFEEDYLYGQEDFSNKQANDDDQDADVDDNSSDSTFYAPTGISLVNGRLYVSDRNNNRVLIFD